VAVHNSQIAAIFHQVADLLEIKGANRFRVRAYRQAAQTIKELPERAEDWVEQNKDFTKLSGIGKDLAAKIEEIIKTGGLKQLEKIKQDVPEELRKIMQMEGLGPKRTKQLYQQLKIKSLDDLAEAVSQGKIKDLEGFGQKTEENIKQALQKQGGEKRTLFYVAEEIIEPFLAYLKQEPGLEEAIVAGSYRRKKETVGDIDILALSKNSKKVIQRFVEYEDVKKVVNQGDTKATVILEIGMQVDLRVIAPKSKGAALLYFTGSREHNIRLRKLAMKKNLKVNEYGVFKNKKQVAGKSEQEIFNFLGLQDIPPELRENRGEIQAAKNKQLPELVTLKDLKGDLQMHTSDSDGKASIKEMALAAKQLGHQYIAVTDHTAYLGITQGLEEKGVEQQIKKIDQLNQKLEGITILKSLEVDILKDGKLDISNEILKKLNLVVCSIHSHFNLPLEEQTKRVLKAMDNPYFTIFSHPTGRIIQQREPIKLDLEKVFKKARKNNIVLEINSQPSRLDLKDNHIKRAKELGVKLVISTDAHSPQNLTYLKYGVNQARRGWLEPKDVINTLTLSDLKTFLKG
jgi:DNA polymerase (family 10)